jgi:signal transduction histidine kinase
MGSWRTSAAYRIAFANFIAFAAGLALLGVVVFAAMHTSFSRQLDATMRDEAQTLVDEYRGGGNQNLADAIAEREASGTPTRMLYAVFTPDGRRMLGGLQAQRPPLGLHSISFIDPNGGPDTARAIAVDLSPRERLVVAADQEWLERIDDTVIAVFGVAFIIACIVALAGAAFLGAYLRQRLRTISGAAETIIAGDIRQRMPVGPRRDEFDQVAVTLNRMLDRIEGLMENLRQVSSDVAHDLRTPLARLRTRLEQGVLQRAQGGDAGAVIEQSIKQVDEVLSLFAAILRIAEVESGQPRDSFAPVDLSALVTDLAESYAPAIHDGGRELFWSVEPGLAIDGDRELLAQAVVNLIENSQRHTPAGTIIRITAVGLDRTVCVQVEDNGPGVPNADLHRVVRRFARLESSRNTAGYGLGLNLVSAVAALHGGRLMLKNTGGLCAAIEIPKTLTNKAPGAGNHQRKTERVR